MSEGFKINAAQEALLRKEGGLADVPQKDQEKQNPYAEGALDILKEERASFNLPKIVKMLQDSEAVSYKFILRFTDAAGDVVADEVHLTCGRLDDQQQALFRAIKKTDFKQAVNHIQVTSAALDGAGTNLKSFKHDLKAVSF